MLIISMKGSAIKEDSHEDHSPHHLLFKQESHG